MSDKCLNCERSVDAAFCPACGQPTREPRGPLWGLFGDFFSEFLSLDGKHLRTAARLLVPGNLTELYLAGKRASYVPPVRVYFVASLLFFLLVGFPTPDASRTNVYVNDVLIGRDEPQPDASNVQLFNFEDSPLSRRLQPLLVPDLDDLYAMDPQELLEGYISGLERTVPVALIVFLPILAVGLKLLYVRRPFFYVDHLVFAIHFQSFFFTLFVLVRLANAAGLAQVTPWILNYLVAFLLILPAYLVFALRRVYRQSWILTLVKSGLLVVLYLFLIQPVILITMALVVRGI